MCTCVFHEKGGEVLVVVGTAKDFVLNPRSGSGFVHLYRLVPNEEGGFKLQLVHKTQVEEPPYALCPFQGRLLVGVGPVLRIYDLGKKKLLRKCENKNFPSMLTSIWTQGDRIICSDVQESFHFCKYKRADNTLYTFADDITPRFVTSGVQLDYDTMAGADKFGNLFIVRLPEKVNEDIEEDPTGNRMKWEQGLLNGAPYKLEPLIHFHIGETANSITKASLVPGVPEAIIYSTIMGTIGALVPFVSREDVDFFSHLEMHMRQENPPLCGRDHLSYRSYYFPVKNVIDGDLCEQFTSLDAAKQRSIAQELDRTPQEVMKKLEDIRNNRLM
jgi:splicing factor 3B subunit 3